MIFANLDTHCLPHYYLCSDMSQPSPFDKIPKQPKPGKTGPSDKVQELMDALKKQKEEIQEGDQENSDLPAQQPAELPAADRPLLEEEIQVLQEKLKNAEMKLEEAEDKYLRQLAEFDNFRKRMEREKSESLQYANEKLVKELLPVYDHLEMALQHAQSPKAENGIAPSDEEVTESGAPSPNNALLEGGEIVLRQFRTVLEKFGVVVVEGEGEPFDPHRQESIGVVETAEQAANTVVTVHRKGFVLNGRLIRPALVTVTKEPA